MLQYKEIKKRFENFIILFRLGDFYEMFYEEAEEVSKILGITLTARQGIPMCGIPHGNMDFYIKKLLENNKKIAFCEQVGQVDPNTKIMKRDVVRIVTKSTFIDETQKDYNYLLAIKKRNDIFQLCYFDLGTNICFFEEIESAFLFSAIIRINPSEILLEEKHKELAVFDDIIILNKKNKDESVVQMLTLYLKSLGYDVMLQPINQNESYMRLGKKTLQNLEVLESFHGDKKQGLLFLLDETETPMGRRILRDVLVRPLIKLEQITQRLEIVKLFIKRLENNEFVKLCTGDLPKIYNRIKDLDQWLEFIDLLDNIFINIIQKMPNLENFMKKPHNFIEDYKKLQKEQMIIIENLENKKSLILKEIINLQEKLEKEFNLKIKIKNNNLIGYYLEIKNSSCNKIPSEFLLKQGLVDHSRYTTEQLIKLEGEIAQINMEIINEKNILWQVFKNKFNEKEFYELSNYIGWVDHFQNAAKIAIKNKYYEPVFINTDSNLMEILECRHATIEQKEKFIKNDLILDGMWLITGPNMGGKSTFLRQNALVVLMAQCGLFIPAKAKLPIFHSLFIRIGASDNIVMGESTFMTEMIECSEILQEATHKSFVLLDEIGRGTSMQDGLAISIAIIEYLHDIIRCNTLISTHYNELNHCEDYLSKLSNYCVQILDDTLMFKIIPGVAKSYGISVAKMAKIPSSIIKRCEEIFKNIKISVCLK